MRPTKPIAPVKDFDNAMDYHEAARELAAEAQGREPKLTDKEKINLEIYAERQTDALERDRYLELSRADSNVQTSDVSESRSR